MTFAVCANLALRSACVYAAVTIYHEVIADAVEASLAMPAINIFNGEVLALCSGTAMNFIFVSADVFGYAIND